MTNAALIAEARRYAVLPYDAAPLVAQLADALEAVTRELGDVAIEAAAARYQCETAQARLTKVRERAIHREAECHLCGATWYEPYEDRDHQPTACPARRMEPGTLHEPTFPRSRLNG